MASADNTVRQNAKAWIDQINAGNGMSGGWRLESISKRYRYYKVEETGERKRVPIRIRRFARGIPWGFVHEAIRYLESLAPYTDIVFNGERVSLSYRPTSTIWVRDDQHAVDGNAAGTYTLIQDLIESGATDDLQTPSSASCSEEVVSKWVWDSPTVEDLPVGGQGIIYSIQAVHRNEDGTFDYALVKRTAKTQHLDAAVSECNSFETVTVETWDNVYGTPEAPCDDTGTPLSIPSGCIDLNGVLIVRQISENQDCTMKIVVQRHVSKSLVSEINCGKTKYEHSHGETKRAQAASIGDAPPPSGGKVVTHKSEKRQDGLFDNTVSSKQELPVPESVREVRKTLRGVVTSQTDRNQDEPSVPSSPSGMRVGETFRSTVTEGGLFDNVHETVDPTPVGEVGVGCNKTVFEEADSQSSNVPEKPESQHGTAGGGVWSEKVLSLTEMGTWDYRTVTHREITVSGAAVELRRTIRGTIKSITDKNQPASSVPSSAAQMRPGEAYRSTMNPGGSFDNVHEFADATPGGSIAEACTRSSDVHSHSQSENVLDKPAVERTAAVNQERSKTARITEFGTWDVETRDVVYQPWGPTVVSTVTGNVRTVKTEVFRNTITSPSRTAGVNEDVSVNVNRNDHGSFDGHVVTETFTPWSGVVGTASCPGHTTVITVGMNTVNPPNIVGADGTEVSVSASLNNHGTFDWNVRETAYIPTTGQAHASWATETSTTVVKRRTLDSDVYPPGETGQASISLDEAGTASTSTTTYNPIPVDSGWIEWESTEQAPTHTYRYKCGYRTFCNLSAPPRPPAGSSSSIRVSINKFGLFDGTVSYTHLKSWENANNDASDQGISVAVGYFYVGGKKYRIEGKYRKSIKGWAGRLYHHPGLPGGVFYTEVSEPTLVDTPTDL